MKQSSLADNSWTVAQEDSALSSFMNSSMPRLHHDDYFEKQAQSNERVGLTQEQLDRLGVWRRRSSSSSCSTTSSEFIDEEYDRKDLPDDKCSFRLKNIFGALRRISESKCGALEREAVLEVRNSTLEAAAAVSHAAEDVRIATMTASEHGLLHAISEPEEALAALKGKEHTEAAKVAKDKENQPPKRKVARVGTRAVKRGKSSIETRGSRAKQSILTV
jgi:hypothetical protein